MSVHCVLQDLGEYSAGWNTGAVLLPESAVLLPESAALEAYPPATGCESPTRHLPAISSVWGVPSTSRLLVVLSRTGEARTTHAFKWPPGRLRAGATAAHGGNTWRMRGWKGREGEGENVTDSSLHALPGAAPGTRRGLCSRVMPRIGHRWLAFSGSWALAQHSGAARR